MPEAAVAPPAGAVQVSQPKPSDPPLQQAPPSGKTAEQAFDEQVLDEMDKPAAPTAAPAAPAPKAADATPTMAKPTTPAQPAPTKAAETAPDDDREPTSGKPSDFRKWGQRQATKAQKYAGEVSQLRERLAQLEAAGPKDGQDAVALAQELARVKKANEDYEGELRLTRYERSSEYKEKFEKPAQQAGQRAYAKVTQLFVIEPNPDDPDNPKERQATKADFDEVYSAATDGLAWKMAKAKFGDAAPLVMGHREKVQGLWQDAYAAVEQHKAHAGELEQQWTAQSKQQEIARNGAWQKVNDAFIKKNPEMFGPRDGDEEGNALLSKATDFVDTVFSSDRNRYSPEQQLAMDARARNWALAFPRLKRDNGKLKAELAEANKTIETLRGSGPGKPTPGGEAGPKKAKSWEDEFDDKVPA